jgi:hypothetical protein
MKYSLAAGDGVAMPTIRARGRTYFIGRSDRMEQRPSFQMSRPIPQKITDNVV